MKNRDNFDSFSFLKGQARLNDEEMAESASALLQEQPSSPSVAEETMSEALSETSGTMDDPKKRKRSKKRRSKGRKIPGIFACTRKSGSIVSSSSDEEDRRPVRMKTGKHQDEEQDTAIDSKLQELQITLAWIFKRKVGILQIVYTSDHVWCKVHGA